MFKKKKLLSLLFVFTLVACGGSDDDISTDPFIGTWELIYTGEDASSYDTTLEVRGDGTFTETDILYLGNAEDAVGIHTGTWRNLGSDLNSLSQTYYLTLDSDSAANTDVTVLFSSDFNSLNIDTYRGDWERQ